MARTSRPYRKAGSPPAKAQSRAAAAAAVAYDGTLGEFIVDDQAGGGPVLKDQ